jgi:hypothetical protein
MSVLICFVGYNKGLLLILDNMDMRKVDPHIAFLQNRDQL